MQLRVRRGVTEHMHSAKTEKDGKCSEKMTAILSRGDTGECLMLTSVRPGGVLT